MTLGMHRLQAAAVLTAVLNSIARAMLVWRGTICVPSYLARKFLARFPTPIFDANFFRSFFFGQFSSPAVSVWSFLSPPRSSGPPST